MLVGGLKHFLFSIIYGIILPIDYIIFSRWLLHHQPGWISRGFHDGKWGFHRTIESQMGISTINDSGDVQSMTPNILGLKTKVSGFDCP